MNYFLALLFSSVLFCRVAAMEEDWPKSKMEVDSRPALDSDWGTLLTEFEAIKGIDDINRLAESLLYALIDKVYFPFFNTKAENLITYQGDQTKIKYAIPALVSKINMMSYGKKDEESVTLTKKTTAIIEKILKNFTPAETDEYFATLLKIPTSASKVDPVRSDGGQHNQPNGFVVDAVQLDRTGKRFGREIVFGGVVHDSKLRVSLKKRKIRFAIKKKIVFKSIKLLKKEESH